jgi:hypothetical protein
MKLFSAFEHPEMVEEGVRKLRDFRTGERPLNSEELAGIREEQRVRSEEKTPPPVETTPPRRSDNSMAAFDEWQRHQEAEEEYRQERFGQK